MLTWAVYSFAMFARTHAGVDRPARGVAVGGGLRDRDAELPAGQLLRHDEPHVPLSQVAVHVFLLGVSHRTAPVELRERLDFSSRDLGAAVEALAARPSAAETVVLSTCNRSEIYVASGDPARAREEARRRSSASTTSVPADVFTPHLFAHDNEAAVAHLFRVAAGLDSLVVGEPQILGQVKDAFQAAAEQHAAPARCSSKLFHWSFGVGKRVRTETALGEGAVSVSFAAVALARKIFGRLQGRRVLVVGAGEISTLTAQHLRSQGVGEIVITSRTHAHAEALAAEVGGTARAVGRHDRTALGAADIVITATGSQRPIITRAQRRGGARPAPRATRCSSSTSPCRATSRPSVGDIEQVFLYNVDDLQTHRAGEPVATQLRRSTAPKRSSTRKSRNSCAWQRSRGAVPTVVALRQRFESHPPLRAAAARRQAGGPAARGARSRRRGDAAHRREAAPRADRAAQGASRRGNPGRLHGSRQPSVPASRATRRQ